ncbi:uncharacterized protein LOC110680883 [Aedes aegypti]|uniref:Uncharacterized protein n=1 Tax=Aedes aegypti TaxID=7159 RepID=A0A903VEI7_AEDAE|nr:uncharacterized protein LOC110680883 [Aedes aegypti]
MYAVLERIRKLESEFKLKTNNGKPRQANIEAFWPVGQGARLRVRWRQDIGVFRIRAGAGSDQGFQGGRSVCDRAEKLIFSVTADSKIPDIMKDIPVMMVQNLSNLMLALLLIVERFQPEQRLEAVSGRAARSVLHGHVTFSPAEMAELKGTSAFGAALSHCKNIARQYGFIKKFIQGKERRC